MFTRSIIFYIILGLWTLLMGLLSLPFLILPSHYLNKSIKIWISGIFIFLKYICNIIHEVQGLKNIPSEVVLVVSKHQSAFETFALFYYLPNAIFIHKKQLFYIPIFGQYLRKVNMISIERKGGSSTMRSMLKQTKEKASQGFSIIIFPEGTRKKPGAEPDYKSGFVGIYNKMKTPILPVAVNSGKYWPKENFIKKSGKIIIKFLPIIKPNLSRDEVLSEVQKKIEEATNKII
jgi:1-acyl-sn-glycerol-3-phosphate acyltransferase